MTLLVCVHNEIKDPRLDRMTSLGLRLSLPVTARWCPRWCPSLVPLTGASRHLLHLTHVQATGAHTAPCGTRQHKYDPYVQHKWQGLCRLVVCTGYMLTQSSSYKYASTLPQGPIAQPTKELRQRTVRLVCRACSAGTSRHFGRTGRPQRQPQARTEPPDPAPARTARQGVWQRHGTTAAIATLRYVTCVSHVITKTVNNRKRHLLTSSPSRHAHSTSLYRPAHFGTASSLGALWRNIRPARRHQWRAAPCTTHHTMSPHLDSYDYSPLRPHPLFTFAALRLPPRSSPPPPPPPPPGADAGSGASKPPSSCGPSSCC